MKYFLFLLAFLLHSAPEAFAQIQTDEDELPTEVNPQKEPPVIYYLALDKPRGEKRIRYYPGNEIFFKMKGENFTRKATILEVRPSIFMVNGGEVAIGDVHSVTIHKKNGLFRQALVYLPAAGILYFLMDSLNPANTGREGFYPNQGTFIVSGGLVGAGLALQFFKKRTYRIGERNMLKTLQVW
jgi:hypothetical protein